MNLTMGKLIALIKNFGGRGAGGSGGAFVVNMTGVYDEQVDDIVYSLDKPFEELFAACVNFADVRVNIFQDYGEGEGPQKANSSAIARASWDEQDNCLVVIVKTIEEIGGDYSGKISEISGCYKISQNGVKFVNDMQIRKRYLATAYGLYVESSTPGSKKVFRIAVDDSGKITATEEIV